MIFSRTQGVRTHQNLKRERVELRLLCVTGLKEELVSERVNESWSCTTLVCNQLCVCVKVWVVNAISLSRLKVRDLTQRPFNPVHENINSFIHSYIIKINLVSLYFTARKAHIVLQPLSCLYLGENIQAHFAMWKFFLATQSQGCFWKKGFTARSSSPDV